MMGGNNVPSLKTMWLQNPKGQPPTSQPTKRHHPWGELAAAEVILCRLHGHNLPYEVHRSLTSWLVHKPCSAPCQLGIPPIYSVPLVEAPGQLVISYPQNTRISQFNIAQVLKTSVMAFFNLVLCATCPW